MMLIMSGLVKLVYRLIRLIYKIKIYQVPITILNFQNTSLFKFLVSLQNNSLTFSLEKHFEYVILNKVLLSTSFYFYLFCNTKYVSCR